jgi:hypothetical protein
MCALVLSILMLMFNEATITFHFLHPSIKVDLPPFVDDFHSKTKGCIRLKNIYFCFNTFTMSLLCHYFQYGLWTFTLLFYSWWLCKWLWTSFFRYVNMWSCSPIHISFFWKNKLITFDPSWLERWSINWLFTHLPFSLKIHLWNIFVFTNLVWWHRASVRHWSTGFVLCWICN